MSIYATILSIEDERQWIAEMKAEGIDAGVIRDGDPLPEDLDAPIIYQGSHAVPTEEGLRGGSVDLALIPSHITRDGRDDNPEDGRPWPYLRLGVHSCDSDTLYEGKPYVDGGDATVVLTLRQATRLRDALSGWLSEVG
jgi:hypothetical protein